MSKQDIKVQKLAVSNAASLSQIAVKAYSDHYVHLWHDKGAWYIDKCFSVPNLEKELADTNALFFLVYYNNAAVGFMKLNVNAVFESYKKEDALELERIYLTKDASGKGIGTHLIGYVFEFAKQQSKKVIWIKVMDTSTDPISFYQKHGFEPCGTTRLDFVQMKEKFRGMIIMKKILQM